MSFSILTNQSSKIHTERDIWNDKTTPYLSGHHGEINYHFAISYHPELYHMIVIWYNIIDYIIDDGQWGFFQSLMGPN